MNKDAKVVLVMSSLLVMVGTVMIYSSSAVYAFRKYDNSFYFVRQHLVHIFAGIVSAIICMALPIGKLQKHSKGIIIFFMFLLSIVLIPGIGNEIGGARRWFRFFGIGIQPSEMAKLALIIYLADYISRKKYLLQNFTFGLLPALSVIGAMGLLILLEPDMGTFVSVIFIGFVMLFAFGAKIKHLFFLFMGMLPLLYVAIRYEPYRFRRIIAFFDPWKDPKGTGFQLIQSFIALGSGGFSGVGLGESRQKLFFLPESHTDFIFSIIGEELGFIGASAIIVMFGILIWHIFRISLKINRDYSSLIVFGVGVLFAFEFLVNIGVSMGVLPTKGMPLPFISYGGSSLVCHFAAIGLVLSMAKEVE